MKKDGWSGVPLILLWSVSSESRLTRSGPEESVALTHDSK